MKKITVIIALALFTLGVKAQMPGGFGFGREWQRKSLQWIAGLAEDPTCAAVLCSHDPGFEPQTMEF